MLTELSETPDEIIVTDAPENVSVSESTNDESTNINIVIPPPVEVEPEPPAPVEPAPHEHGDILARLDSIDQRIAEILDTMAAVEAEEESAPDSGVVEIPAEPPVSQETVEEPSPTPPTSTRRRHRFGR